MLIPLGYIFKFINDFPNKKWDEYELLSLKLLLFVVEGEFNDLSFLYIFEPNNSFVISKYLFRKEKFNGLLHPLIPLLISLLYIFVNVTLLFKKLLLIFNSFFADFGILFSL